MKITVTVIRPWGDPDSSVLNMTDDEMQRHKLYLEYREVWEKDDGDEESKTKRLVFRFPTGRQLRYIDRVNSDTLEDLGLRDEPVGIVYVLMPHDLTVRRFRLRGV